MDNDQEARKCELSSLPDLFVFCQERRIEVNINLTD
jgi:hypothetical protein